MALQPFYAATVLRLSLGVMYLAHGLLKLLVFTPAGTAWFLWFYRSSGFSWARDYGS